MVQSFSIVRVKPLKLEINVEDQTALKTVLKLQTFIAKVSPGQMLCRYHYTNKQTAVITKHKKVKKASTNV